MILWSSRKYITLPWMLIFDIVTIKRNAAILQRYENNRCIMLTNKLPKEMYVEL